jgi:hypothetical protein
MRLTRLALATVMAILLASPALADPKGPKSFRETLKGFEEVPAISTEGNGRFKARISKDETMIDWELSYADLEGVDATGAPLQAHIHFGAEHTNGGISVFLCTNLGNAPAGTIVQACPPQPAAISGTIMAADVTGPAAQGITAGELDELIKAMRAGKTYANVHTTAFPTGEIRGQLDDKLDMKDEKHDDRKGGDKRKH